MENNASTRWLSLTSPPRSPDAAPADNLSIKLPAAAKTEQSTAIAVDPVLANTVTNVPKGIGSLVLTPPPTPEKSKKKCGSNFDSRTIATDGATDMDLEEMPKPGSSDTVDFTAAHRTVCPRLPKEPWIYCEDYRLDEVIGHGAWSRVHRAMELPQESSSLQQLPLSDMKDDHTSCLHERQAKMSRVMAVKVPIGRHAEKVLCNEALILTYLSTNVSASAHLVAFRGFDIVAHAIVMECLSISLESHVKAAVTNRPVTTLSSDPIIGPHAWVAMAETLVSGLKFLHDLSCVHGDIKPANILLRFDANRNSFTPVYCDFSSARLVSSQGMEVETETEEVSAVTAEYTSPELFAALKRKDGSAITKESSDVFALGLTLLFAALGESPYSYASSKMQRLVMAQAGTPLDFARAGSQAGRVMRGGLVAKVVAPAVRLDLNLRVNVDSWMSLLTETFSTDKS